MQVNSKGEVSDFEDGITEVMYRIEGISHFTITNFYTFNYLNYNSDEIDSDPTDDQLIAQWYGTFTGYNSVLLDQLSLS